MIDVMLGLAACDGSSGSSDTKSRKTLVLPKNAGTTYQSIGNTVFESDGSTHQQIENTVFSSDGTVCQTIGTCTFCN